VDATIIDRIDELEIDTTAIDDRVDVLEGAILDYHHIQVVASDT
jgi:hypothetical protein